MLTTLPASYALVSSPMYQTLPAVSWAYPRDGDPHAPIRAPGVGLAIDPLAAGNHRPVRIGDPRDEVRGIQRHRLAPTRKPRAARAAGARDPGARRDRSGPEEQRRNCRDGDDCLAVENVVPPDEPRSSTTRRRGGPLLRTSSRTTTGSSAWCHRPLGRGPQGHLAWFAVAPSPGWTSPPSAPATGLTAGSGPPGTRPGWWRRPHSRRIPYGPSNPPASSPPNSRPKKPAAAVFVSSGNRKARRAVAPAGIGAAPSSAASVRVPVGPSSA